jgi:hypothetical protein
VSRTVAALLPRIAPIIARLSSNHDGERLACVAAIERLLLAAHLGFVDLAAYLTALPAPRRRSAKHGPKRQAVPDTILAGLRMVVASEFASERQVEIAARLLSHAQRFAGLTQKQLDLANDLIERVRARADGGER